MELNFLALGVLIQQSAILSSIYLKYDLIIILTVRITETMYLKHVEHVKCYAVITTGYISHVTELINNKLFIIIINPEGSEIITGGMSDTTKKVFTCW